MNVKRALMAAVGLLITSQALANSDTGRIAELYSHPTGSMAVRLEGGLDNSEKDTKCGNTTLEWAGVAAEADASIKSSLLAAYAQDKRVTLVTFGTCIGGWIKIEAMHILKD